MTSIGHTTVLRSHLNSRCSLHRESWNAFVSNRSRSMHEETHSLERTSVCIGISWMHFEQVIQPWGALAAKRRHMLGNSHAGYQCNVPSNPHTEFAQGLLAERIQLVRV